MSGQIFFTQLCYTHMVWGFKVDMEPVPGPDFKLAGLPFDWSLLVDRWINGRSADRRSTGQTDRPADAVRFELFKPVSVQVVKNPDWFHLWFKIQ
jgi:hypothetical protein